MSYASTGSDEDCVQQGVASVRPILQKIVELRAHWNPTGYYQPSELYGVAMRIFNELAAARKAITSVLDGKNGDAVVKLADRIGVAQLDLQRFINVAKTTNPNALIEAPDFKASALDAMYQVAYVTGAAVNIECASWPITLITQIASTWVDIGDGIATVAGEIWSATKTILAVPGKAIDLVKTVVIIAAVGGAAYVAYELFGKPKRSARSRARR
jgi:hypothetical protein